MSEISPVMNTLAKYIANAVDSPLPDDVAEKTKHHLIDTISAIVSGSRLLPGQKAIAYAKTLGGTEEALVLGTRIVTTAINAAFANGMMAHADETDDSHVASQTHPGCGVVPAALAFAEREDRDGSSLLRAVALGYDICARSTFSLNPFALRAASHSSHSFGPLFGAAAAAGGLARLTTDQARFLIAYTVQQASGVDCWARDKDHVEKAFDFGGNPARNGVTAATLVKAGFTAVDDVLTGEKNFFTAYSAKPDPEAFVRDLGSVFEIINTNIKRWSVGTPIQAALDSLATLIEENSFSADDVEELSVTIHPSGAKTVNDRTIPDINLQHLVAVMLVDGTVTFASSHDKERMQDPRIVAVKRVVRLKSDEEYEKSTNRQALLSIKLRDGQVLTNHTRAVRGTSINPMSRAEVGAKSLDLLAPVLGGDRARQLIDAIWSIEKLESARDLRPLLTA